MFKMQEYEYVYSPDFLKNYGVFIKPGPKLVSKLTSTLNYIKAPLLSPVELSFNASYNRGSSIGNLADMVTNPLQHIRNTAHIMQYTDEYSGQSNIRTVDTIMKYDGNSSISFSVSFLIMEHYYPFSYKDIINYLVEITNPKEVPTTGNLTAPFEWSPSLGTKDAVRVDNTFSVGVGRWLVITHLLPTSFSYQQSAMVNEKGNPAYMIFNVSFETGRVLDYKEIQRWFKFK